MITPAQFVQNFVGFADPAKYPPTQIQFWLNQAYSQLGKWSLGNQIDYAAQLFTAHNLILEYNAANSVGTGATAGTNAAALASKSVGGVAAAYDTAGSSIGGAGQWNATSYGQRLYPLLRGAIAGPIYDPGPDPYYRDPPIGGFGILGL